LGRASTSVTGILGCCPGLGFGSSVLPVRYRVVDRAAVVLCFNFGHFFPPRRALVVPGVVRFATHGAFPRRGSFVLLWAVPEAMVSCTPSTSCCYLALDSYVVISLIIIALLQSIRFIVSFAIKNLFLPNKAFVNNAVCILRNDKFDNNECCRFLIMGFRKPFYEFNFRVGHKWFVIHK
jgi:hypothetical protein